MAGHSVDLRTDGRVWQELVEHLADAEQEQAGALLVRGHPGDNPSVLVAERWRPVPDRYVTDRDHGLAWDGRFNLRLAEEAEAAGLGVVMVHRHGGHWPPRLSPTDRERGEALLHFLRRRCPLVIHGILVIAPTGLAGWLEMPDTSRRRWREIRIAGPGVQVLPQRRTGALPSDQDRQVLAFGPQGIRALGLITIGIVGLSGGGSHVAQQLIHAGAGELVVVDPQVVDESNLRRLVGADRRDIERTRKVAVFRRLARLVRPEMRITVVPEAFPSLRSLLTLRRVDVVLGCVDGWDVRDDLNRFALEHRIPYVDIGAVIIPPAGAMGIRVSGQIAVVLPGGPCLRCMGLVTDARVEEARRRRQGYLADVHDPQVISINGVLASEAVTTALMLIAGGGSVLDARRRYTYPPGLIRSVATRAAPGCPACEAAGLRDR